MSATPSLGDHMYILKQCSDTIIFMLCIVTIKVTFYTVFFIIISPFIIQEYLHLFPLILSLFLSTLILVAPKLIILLTVLQVHSR